MHVHRNIVKRGTRRVQTCGCVLLMGLRGRASSPRTWCKAPSEMTRVVSESASCSSRYASGGCMSHAADRTRFSQSGACVCVYVCLCAWACVYMCVCVCVCPKTVHKRYCVSPRACQTCQYSPLVHVSAFSHTCVCTPTGTCE